MPPQLDHIGMLIIFSCRNLKNSKYREGLSLNSLFYLKRSSKRSSVTINPLPGGFIKLTDSCHRKGQYTPTHFVTKGHTPLSPHLFQGPIHLS